MSHNRARKTTAETAFSLAEVMVASAVLSIVMAIFLGTLTTSMSLWRNTENKLSADREGRAAELLLAQDLSGVVMTTNPQLWPRVVDGRFQFLTTMPSDYQDTNRGDFGDVCYVEYAFEPESHTLVRGFLGSKETYDLLRNSGNALPAPPVASAVPQLLATNVLKNMYDSVRGLTVYQDPLRTNFVMLGTNMMPTNLPYTAPPAAVEVNFAAADPEVVKNEDLLSRPDYKLRNAGFYSFRLAFPKVPQ